MKKYKLIKMYPFCNFKLGGIVELDNNDSDNLQHYPEFWQEIVEKDYEILSVQNINSNFYGYNEILDLIRIKNIGYTLNSFLNDGHSVASGHFRIYSVKRLSDGEIFTINEIVKINFPCRIKEFEIKNNDLLIWLHSEFFDEDKKLLKKMPGNCRVDYLKNIHKIKQSLFTTEDGVDIYEGDEFYYVKFKENKYSQGKIFETVKVPSKWSFTYEPEFELYFSTKEKAEEYILMNKPCLSLNDIEEVMKRKRTKWTILTELKETINTKING